MTNDIRVATEDRDDQGGNRSCILSREVEFTDSEHAIVCCLCGMSQSPVFLIDLR